MCFYGSNKKSFERSSALGADSDHGYSSWSLIHREIITRTNATNKLRKDNFWSLSIPNQWSFITKKYVSMNSLSDSFLNVMEKLPSLRSKSPNTHQIPINFQCWGVLYALSNLDKGEVAAVLYLSCRDWCAGHLHLEKELGWESYMQTPPSYSWLVEGLLTTLVSWRWRIKPAKILELHSLP